MRKRTHREIDCLFPFYRERNPTITKLSAQQPRGRGAEEMTAFYLMCIYHQSSRWRQIYHTYHVFAQHLIPPHFPHLKPNCFFFSSLGRERHAHDYRARLHHWSYHNKLHVNSFEKCLFLHVLDQIPNPHFLHILHYLLGQVRMSV